MARGAFVRRAGSGRLLDGRRLTWTVADGSRGRRWRSTTIDADGRLVLALLVEVAPDGTLAKLEAAAPSGLLTLHPEGETLHGNLAGPAGIEHVRRPFGTGWAMLVDASPIPLAVVAHGLGSRVPVRVGTELLGVAVGDDLRLRDLRASAERVGDRAWRIATDSDVGPLRIVLDAEGVPVLDAGRSWALEQDEGARG